MARRERVLVVEGDRMRRELLVTVLEAAGYSVAAATSGEEAFSRLRAERRGIDRLVTGPLTGAHICAAVLADAFRECQPRREALVLRGGEGPAEVAALLQRGMAAPASAPAPAPARGDDLRAAA